MFKRIFAGLFLGTLFGLALVYVFRLKWSSFPSSIFVISFHTGLFLVFTINSLILRFAGRIKKNVVLVGQEKKDGIIQNNAYIEKKEVESIEELIKCEDVDEIIICKKIHGEKNFNLLIYLLQKLKTNVFFVPYLYGEILSESFNGINTSQFLATFLGKKSDTEEFLIRAMDIAGSLIMLIATAPLLFLITILVKISSSGPAFYIQDRAGKDGKIFALCKFRTMIKDAEKTSGLSPAMENDSRITKIGGFLRKTRLDELPQLWNVLKGEMSLVGPRPENLYRVKTHKALQGLRLAVKPGMTGLAQIKSLYDLHPKHKIRYDFLYIQRRSLLLNLYILLKTIPVILLKKGW
ncbi:MAG: sugar transferase [Planctomycetota bacterium]